MACKECEKLKDPCSGNTGVPCDCVQKDMSTDCSLYTGDDLICSGIKKNTILTDVIGQMDAFICNTFAGLTNGFNLISVGLGAPVYKGVDNLGKREIRSIVSEDTTKLDIVQNDTTIGINPGNYTLTLNNGFLIFDVTTLQGTTNIANIDISTLSNDTFLNAASFDETGQDITLSLSDLTNYIVNLSYLDNHLESVVYNNSLNQIEFTITDGSVFNLDLAAIIQSSQVQSNYLENNVTAPSHILNRNPVKTVSFGSSTSYNVIASDNNYVIEIDNGTNDVTINLSTITASSNFFTGFVQKGTGEVTFTNFTIKPLDFDNILYGQGHVASVEVINSTRYLLGQLKPL